MYGRDIKFFAGRPYKKSTSVRIDSASSPRLPLKLRAEDCEYQKCRCPMLSVPAPRERKSDGRMPFEGSGARYATVSFDSKLPPDMPKLSFKAIESLRGALPAMFSPIHVPRKSEQTAPKIDSTREWNLRRQNEQQEPV